jgi:hypothetical protein
MGDGKVQRDTCTKTVTDNMSAVDIQMIQQCKQVIRHVRKKVSRRWHGAATMSTQIIGDYPVMTREYSGNSHVPEGKIGAQAMY